MTTQHKPHSHSSDEAKFIFDELRSETIIIKSEDNADIEVPKYGLLIDKRQYAEIIGCSVSSIDNYIKQGMNLPNYKKMGTAKNAKVVFNLRDVAEYIAGQTVRTA